MTTYRQDDTLTPATDVSEEDYMQHYAPAHYEWRAGEVFPMSPVHDRHDALSRYLATLIDAYLEARPLGELRQDPFVMRLPNIPSRRQPDLQVIRQDNPHVLTPTFMDGPADICVEIVSPGSVVMDRGTKYDEYARGGVREYWLIDPTNNDALFYRLQDAGVYQRQVIADDGHYRTPLLPDFRLHVPTLWTAPLPGPSAIVQMMQAMLSDADAYPDPE